MSRNSGARARPSSSRNVPRASRASAGGADELVESGGFRVDRKKALEKLMRFQLPDARMYLLSWVQAAVAGGARRIEVGEDSGGGFMRFDGEPWPAYDLKDPYSAFFNRARGRRGDRAAAFAIGLLSALRLGPREIRVRSGALELVVLGVDSEEVSRLTSAEDGTSIRVPDIGTTEAGYLRAQCGWCPAELVLFGERLPARSAQGPSLEFKGRGKSGRVWLAPAGASGSEVHLLAHGVEVSTVATDSPIVPVRAVLQDDGLNLDLSGTRVVQDRKLKGALGSVARQAAVLVERTIREAHAEAREIGPRVNADDWCYWDDLLHGVIPACLASERSPDELRVREFSLRVASLRRACLARLKELNGRRKGLAAKLWAAPVAFDTERRPLSLKDVDSLRRGLGHVPVSERGEPVANGAAVWCLRPTDRDFLEAVFPGELRPVRQGVDGDRIDLFERGLLGDQLLVTQHLRLKQGEARVGLSRATRPSGARLRWLLRGRAPLVTEAELGGLRLDAVIDVAGVEAPWRPEDASGRELLAALREAADLLYQEAAARYVPGAEDSPVQAAIREHLLDYLSARRTERPGWIGGARIFRDVQGRMFSLDQLAELGASGLKPVLVTPPHPAALAHVSRGRPDRVRELVGDAQWLGGLRRIQPKARGKASARERGGGEAPSAPAALTPEERVERLKRKLARLVEGDAGLLTRERLGAVRAVALAASPAIAKVGSGWAVHLKHPLVMAALDLPDHEAADAYLASLLFTAINRDSSVSDEDDIAMQAALARQLLDS